MCDEDNINPHELIKEKIDTSPAEASQRQKTPPGSPSIEVKVVTAESNRKRERDSTQGTVDTNIIELTRAIIEIANKYPNASRIIGCFFNNMLMYLCTNCTKEDKKDQSPLTLSFENN
tara:strand:- start:72 stop:425 length:354 start_codon:yes stop_codon:yes gene_type:complete